jgi:hypothetical protein
MIYLKKIAAMAALAVSINTIVGMSAIPVNAQTCGTFRGVKANNRGRAVWASGTIGNSCPGWTQHCVTLWWQGVVAPFSVENVPEKTSCSPLKTGLTSGISTASVTCKPGYYYSRVTVYSGSKVVKEVSSNNYDFTGNCL